MPFVTINVAAGRDIETLNSCLTAVHNAVRDSLGVRDTAIRVVINEVPPELWSSGGQKLAKSDG